MIEIEIEVEDRLCEDLIRELVIKSGDVEIRSGEFRSDSKEAMLLALDLIRAGSKILDNHELYV